ncbi:hypothetical protein EH171_04150 [Enterovibrio baiacu]|nr:hypothetical protein [Enterovibrio baiacu]
MSKMTTCKTVNNIIKAAKESQSKPEINHGLLLFWRSKAQQGEKTLNFKVEVDTFMIIAYRGTESIFARGV